MKPELICCRRTTGALKPSAANEETGSRHSYTTPDQTKDVERQKMAKNGTNLCPEKQQSEAVRLNVASRDRTDGGRDPDESESMHLCTCEHLPAHILQVSEQPETWSKG